MAERICNLVIDSCCDLPYELVKDRAFYVMEFPYEIDGDQFMDDLYQESSPHEFYDRMRAGSEPHTAQIPIPVIMDMFDRILEDGKPTVILAFSSGLSGTFSTISHYLYDEVLAEHPDAEIYLVDSKLASVAEGFLVYGALEQIDEGMSARELVEWIKEKRWFVDEMFTVDTLDALKRGGRIPTAFAALGAKLDIKPLLGFDLEGHLGSCGMSRGRRKSFKEIVKYYRENGNFPDDRLVLVADADAKEDLAVFKDMFSPHGGDLEFLETSIGPTIGTHVGPGMIALVFWGKDRRLRR